MEVRIKSSDLHETIADFSEDETDLLYLNGNRILLMLTEFSDIKKKGEILLKSDERYNKATVVCVGNRLTDNVGKLVELDTIKVGDEVRYIGGLGKVFKAIHTDGTEQTFHYVTYDSIVWIKRKCPQKN